MITKHVPLWEHVINELGGYQKCKETLDTPNIDMIMNAQALREHMLEYRRANGIFEEGDKVVIKDRRFCPKFWVWRHDTNWRPDHSLLDCGDGVLYPFGNFEFRHATDAEIKAGHRINETYFTLLASFSQGVYRNARSAFLFMLE